MKEVLSVLNFLSIYVFLVVSVQRMDLERKRKKFSNLSTNKETSLCIRLFVNDSWMILGPYIYISI